MSPMHSPARQWNALFLALLLIWAGVSYAHHAEPHDSDSRAASLSKQAGDHGGKVHHACHDCCHGAHVQTACIAAFKFIHPSSQWVATVLVTAPLSHLLPPPTPPPQR